MSDKVDMSLQGQKEGCHGKGGEVLFPIPLSTAKTMDTTYKTM